MFLPLVKAGLFLTFLTKVIRAYDVFQAFDSTKLTSITGLYQCARFLPSTTQPLILFTGISEIPSTLAIPYRLLGKLLHHTCTSLDLPQRTQNGQTTELKRFSKLKCNDLHRASLSTKAFHLSLPQHEGRAGLFTMLVIRRRHGRALAVEMSSTVSKTVKIRPRRCLNQIG